MTNDEGKNGRVLTSGIRISLFFSHSDFVIRHFPAAMVLLFSFALGAYAQETEVQYLSGHGKDDAVPWKFFCTTNAQSGYWTNLPVPSCWELHGFGKINYHRDATNSYDERGLYEHEFSVPQ